MASSTRDCVRCGAGYERHSPGISRCTVCQRFASVVANAAKARRGGPGPGCTLSLAEFACWFTASVRRCTYCTIPEELLSELGVLTQMGLPLRRLGVDRLDNGAPYGIGNIALCCFACNKVKSNTFSTAEMRGLGAAVAAQWSGRLAARGIRWNG